MIVRETKREAWEAAQWLYDRIDRETVEATRSATGAAGSLSQDRMNALNAGPLPKDARALEIYPDLWSGIGLTRAGNAVAIVGDPDTVERRLRDYEARGFGTFILSAYPLIDEAYRFADLVMPRLRGTGTARPPSCSNAVEFASARSG